jgi:hypothetical protein
MLYKKKNERQIGFYSTFEEQLSRNHPLYLLANKIESGKYLRKPLVNFTLLKADLQSQFD